jgi:hypothetical protein
MNSTRLKSFVRKCWVSPNASCIDYLPVPGVRIGEFYVYCLVHDYGMILGGALYHLSLFDGEREGRQRKEGRSHNTQTMLAVFQDG